MTPRDPDTPPDLSRDNENIDDVHMESERKIFKDDQIPVAGGLDDDIIQEDETSIHKPSSFTRKEQTVP